MRVGVTAGKFYPFHKGHLHMLETAQANCDILYVFVVASPKETPNADHRARWVEKMLWINGRTKFDNESFVLAVPNIPGHENDSKAWAEYVKCIARTVDVVFTSEEYGHTWANELGAEHFLVDQERNTYPVSGTMVREDPHRSFHMLPGVTREHYAKKVCLVGGESVGKTTAAKRLALELDSPYTPEAGRIYTETHGVDKENRLIWRYIHDKQPEFEDFACHVSESGLVVCDTDLLLTTVWYEAWVGKFDSTWRAIFNRALERTYDMYFVLTEEVPWIQDELGTRGEQDKRAFFTERMIELLEYTDRPYTVVEGSDYESRYHQVLSVTRELISG